MLLITTYRDRDRDREAKMLACTTIEVKYAAKICGILYTNNETNIKILSSFNMNKEKNIKCKISKYILITCGSINP